MNGRSGEVPGLPNTAGTLALHLAGNLQHYIGARWAGTGYVRDRDAEFARRGVSRAEMVTEVERTRTVISSGLARVTPEELREDYPEPIAESHVRTEEYLVHLCTHVAYHLGQLDSHRRIVTGNASGVGALRPAELGAPERLAADGLNRSSSARRSTARSLRLSPRARAVDRARPPRLDPTFPSRTMRFPDRPGSTRNA